MSSSSHPLHKPHLTSPAGWVAQAAASVRIVDFVGGTYVIRAMTRVDTN